MELAMDGEGTETTAAAAAATLWASDTTDDQTTSDTSSQVLDVWVTEYVEYADTRILYRKCEWRTRSMSSPYTVTVSDEARTRTLRVTDQAL